MYEIEHRAVLLEKQHIELEAKLRLQAKNLGSDDKDVSYYIFPEKLLKVVRNVSKGTGTLSLKLSALGQGSAFRELEIPFPAEHFETMNAVCKEISTPQQVITGTQKRTNFEYQGVEIALKWSEDWGYHVELEKVVDSLSDKEMADTAIFEVAAHFSITLMSEEEVAEFARTVREKNKAT